MYYLTATILICEKTYYFTVSVYYEDCIYRKTNR